METKILEITDTRTILELAEVKKYLRVSSFNTTEDMLISGKLIPGAINLCEQYLNRDILSKDASGGYMIPKASILICHLLRLRKLRKLMFFTGTIKRVGLWY